MPPNHKVDFKSAIDWSAANRIKLYAWHATGLLRLRELILSIFS